LFSKLSNTWSRYLYSRGMRLSTCTLSSTLLVFGFTLNLIIQDAMIGEWELDTKDYHITIINLSREVQKLDETYSCFTSTHIYLSKVSTFYIQIFIKYSMTIVGCSYLSLCIHVVHSTLSFMLHFVNYHWTSLHWILDITS